MVGGSTTECLYLDDTQAITYLLQQYLNDRVTDSVTVKVYNAGKSGDRSYDHIAMISQRIMHLEPDLILVLCGLNDLVAAIYEADYIHLPVTSGPTLGFFRLAKFLSTEFQFSQQACSAGSRPEGAQSGTKQPHEVLRWKHTTS